MDAPSKSPPSSAGGGLLLTGGRGDGQRRVLGPYSALVGFGDVNCASVEDVVVVVVGREVHAGLQVGA